MKRINLVEHETDVDEVWRKLTKQQKLKAITSQPRVFGISKNEMKRLLFTLPPSEKEIIASFATNNGGAIIYAKEPGPDDKVWIGKYSDDNIYIHNYVYATSRIDKYVGDTAEITTLEYGNTRNDYWISISKESIKAENYEFGNAEAAFRVDILTYYTIFLARTKEFGYPPRIAVKRMTDKYNCYGYASIEHIPSSQVPWIMYLIYTDAVALGVKVHIPEDGVLLSDTFMDGDKYDDIDLLSRTAYNLVTQIASKLLEITGVNVRVL